MLIWEIPDSNEQPGDLNRDGERNLRDLKLMFDEWLKSKEGKAAVMEAYKRQVRGQITGQVQIFLNYNHQTDTLSYQNQPLSEKQITKNNNNKQKPSNNRINIHDLLRQEQPYMMAKNQQFKGRQLVGAFNHKAHYRRA